MIKKKEINKLFNLSRTFLKKRPNLNNLGNNFLFLQSVHLVHLSKYKFVNSNSPNFLFFSRYIFEFSKNLVKIILFFFKIIFTRNHTNINNKSKKKIIIVSHLNNIQRFKKNIDTQYFGVEKEFGKKKSIFFYLDHLNTSKKQRSYFLNIKKNIFINNYCIEISTYKKIILNMIKEFSFIYNHIKKSNNNFEKKFYLECAKYLFSLSTIKNIILYYNLEKLIIKNKITNILITLEGHPYEYLIFLLGKKYKIKIFAYQISYITKGHYSMFLNLGNNLMPSKILANGKIGYDFLKKKFNPVNVVLLGSNKYRKKIKIKKINNLNLLVIPSNFDGEASEFIEFCYRCLKKNKNLKTKLIFRLHPEINKFDFIKKNSNILKNEKRIKISDSILIDDISSCKFVLYRSSSAVIDAVQQGLIPIFFSEKRINFQSDPLWQLKSKITVKNYYELSKVLDNKKQLNKRKYLEYINFANNYYKPINYRKIRKIL
jgi:hypothetical protein